MVDSLTYGAVHEALTVNALNGLGYSARELELHINVLGYSRTRVAVRQEQQLAERVPVDKPLDSLGSGHFSDVCGQHLVLGSVASGFATVGFGARISRGATRDVPVGGPVAVDVGADARGAVADLARLAPKAVALVSVDEACWWSTDELQMWIVPRFFFYLPSGFTMGRTKKSWLSRVCTREPFNL